MTLRVLLALAVLGYPFIVYAGLRAWEPRALAAMLVGLFLWRALMRWRQSSRHRFSLPFVLVCATLLAAGLLNDSQLILFVPVLTNAALLAAFARTLRRPPSMVESIARLRFTTLPDEAQLYCRRVTAVWCAFFLANGLFTLWLALYASLESWTMYTGFLAYMAMGLLFTLELVYRSWRFRRYAGAPTDVLFRRIFPPRPAP